MFLYARDELSRCKSLPASHHCGCLLHNTTCTHRCYSLLYHIRITFSNFFSLLLLLLFFASFFYLFFILIRVSFYRQKVLPQRLFIPYSSRLQPISASFSSTFSVLPKKKKSRGFVRFEGFPFLLSPSGLLLLLLSRTHKTFRVMKDRAPDTTASP